MAPPDTVARVRNVASIIPTPPTASNPPARLRRWFMKQLLLIESAREFRATTIDLGTTPQANQSRTRLALIRLAGANMAVIATKSNPADRRRAASTLLRYRPAHCPDDVPVTVLD